MKKGWIFAVLCGLCLLVKPLEIEAAQRVNGVPYTTYAEDYRRRLIPTQDAYIPVHAYREFDGLAMRNPEALFLGPDDTIYIADTGNRRIVAIEKDMASIRSFGMGSLVRPTGLYVDAEGYVFVADFERNLIVKFDPAGEVVEEIGRPDEPMFGANTPFRPFKLTGDSGGNLYIISEGTFQGMIQLNRNGEYLGFFGANPTRPDLRVLLMRQLFSEEVVANFITVNPQTMSNVAIDRFNRVYTVTRGAEGDAIKRLNVSGINRLPENMNDTVNMNAIAVHPLIETIYVTADDGFIRQYDAEGNLLFMFGGKDTRAYQKGLFNIPAAIAVDAAFNVYVLDRAKHELQVFVPTDFAHMVHEAVSLYQDGHYLESKEPWERVLSANAMFDLAHRGIGQAYFKEGMYAEALTAFQLGGDQIGYSNAYWELRNLWLMSHLPVLMIGVIGGYGLVIVHNRYVFPKYRSWSVLKRLVARLKTVRLLRELSFVNTMRKHPLNGIYGIKHEQRTSLLSATILYGVLFLQRLFAIFYMGEAFSTQELATFSLVDELVSFMGPIALFVIANYLVCAIHEGEGTFKQVYMGTIYALAPLLMFWPFLVIASNGLTLNEAVLIESGLFILYGWSALLMFFMVKDMHNYSVLETIKIFMITVFTMIVFIVTMILISGLTRQIFEFVRELIAEVIVRA